MYRIRLSIRNFFYLFLSLSVVIPMIVLGGIALYISSDILRDEIELSNKRQISFFSDRIEQYLVTPEDILEAVAKQLISTDSLSDEIKVEILSAFVDSYSVVTSLQYADGDGIVSLLYPVDELFHGTDVSGHSYYRTVKQTGQRFWAPSRMSEQYDTPVASLSYPLGEGVLTATLSLEAITTMFDDSKYTDSGLILYATDQNGVYIAHTDRNKVHLQEYDPRYINYKMGNIDRISEEELYQGNLYSVYYEIIESSQWMVTLLQPVSSINEPIETMAWSLMILTALVLVIALVFSSFLRQTLSAPLKDLTDATVKISKGNYQVQVPYGGINELTQLSKSIEIMSVEINSREEALNNARTYLSNVIDSMPSVLIGIDPELRITQWNLQAEKITGIKADDALGSNLADTMPRFKKDIPVIRKSIEEMKMEVDENRGLDSSGQKLIENITVYPLTSREIHGAVIRIDDVTERVLMEEILIQNEKMLSVGGLAAGMAHEINNPLAGMIQTANVLSGRLGLDRTISGNEKAAEEASISMEGLKKYMELRDVPGMIDSLNVSGKRIANIVSNMLSFVRNSEDNVSTHLINKIIDNALELAITDYNLRKKYDFRQIEIIKEYRENIPPVICETSKVQQVFFNVLQNGAHAMSESGTEKPHFIIRTSYEEDRRMVVIEIQDNGPGMEESVRRRIFEPFFTTKPIGVGTGLGLSVSYFIITENQKGEMLVDSQPGKGAKFIIKLPASL